MNDALIEAIKNESVEEISAAILQTDFLCVDVSEGNQEDTSALVMELGNFPTLVGFTTEDHAGTFAEYFKDVPLDENDELKCFTCLLYTSPSPRDLSTSRMPSSA